MLYTGAIKNWYGTIAGERKFDYHVVASSPEVFADTLIDIYLCTKPRLTIMDAVVGMDHNGPAAGRPVDVKLVLASEDGFALDWTALKIVGIDPFIVPVMKAAFRRKLLTADGGDIDIAGESIESVAIGNFVAPETASSRNVSRAASPLFATISELIKPGVAFDHKACKRCGECQNICPAKAIELCGGRPMVRRKKCMKCFCCHELCTANAVKIKRSLALKALLACGLLNKRLQRSLEKMFGRIAQSRRSE
jgi:ferredoxin